MMAARFALGARRRHFDHRHREAQLDGYDTLRTLQHQL
jgi:hypothetical protein